MVVQLIDNTTAIGAFTVGLGMSTAGSLAMGLVMIAFFLMMLAMALHIPFEIIFVVLYPLLVVAAYIGGLQPLGILALVIIYFAVMMAKWFWL